MVGSRLTTSWLPAVPSGSCTNLRRIIARCILEKLTLCGDSMFPNCLFISQKNVSYDCSFMHQLHGPIYAQVMHDTRVRWLANIRETDWFYQTVHVLTTVSVRSVLIGPVTWDLSILRVHWFQRIFIKVCTCTGCMTNSIEVWDVDPHWNPSLFTVSWFSSSITIYEALRDICQWR